MATDSVKGGFDLSYQGHMFHMLWKLEKSKSKKKDAFEVKEFGQVVDSALQLSSRETEERYTQEIVSRDL